MQKLRMYVNESGELHDMQKYSKYFYEYALWYSRNNTSFYLNSSSLVMFIKI